MSEVVQCPHCGVQNPPASYLCQGCQQPLAAVAEDATLPSVASVLSVLPGAPAAAAQSGAGPPFAPRNVGARYHKNRYEVIEYLGAANARHHYRVSDTVWALRCINHTCRLFGTKQAGDTPGLCPECATPLEYYQPELLLQEAADPEVFGTAVEVTQRHVHHPALLAPVMYFEESGAMAVRCCLVTPARPARYFRELRGRQDILQVLRWGQRLARGLQALQRYNVVFDTVDADHIGFVSAGPAWVNFEAVNLFSHSAPPTLVMEKGREDFWRLAALLWQALTGLEDYDPRALLSPRVHRLFAPWLQAAAQEVSVADWIEALGDLALHPEDTKLERPSLDLHSGRATHVGRKREINEDSLLVIEMANNNISHAHALGLYAVADGMGGHSAGEVASGLVISTLARRAQAELFGEAVFRVLSTEDIISWLKRAVQEVNAVVHETRIQARSNLGTTLVMAVVSGLQGYIAHVGDSRAYRITSDTIEQITKDHSLIEQLVASRHVSPEEAEIHPHRSLIYKSIGDQSEVEPDIEVVDLAPHERLLLCSDGLNGMVADEDIADVVRASASPQAAAEGLIESANAAGGEDNITAIVVEMSPV